MEAQSNQKLFGGYDLIEIEEGEGKPTTTIRLIGNYLNQINSRFTIAKLREKPIYRVMSGDDSLGLISREVYQVLDTAVEIRKIGYAETNLIIFNFDVDKRRETQKLLEEVLA